MRWHGEPAPRVGRGTDILTPMSTERSCPDCGTQGHMRPEIVWFGEMPFYMDELEAVVSEADIFISIGTSGAVYPAAGFARSARANGAQWLVEVNMEKTKISPHFHSRRMGAASVEVPKLVEELLEVNQLRE